MTDWSSHFELLEQQGWVVVDQALPKDLVLKLFDECQFFWQSNAFKEAQVGRGSTKLKQPDIRGDSTYWLNSEQPSSACNEFLNWSQCFRQELNKRYFLGLNSEEFHFARYPIGAGYQKHMDQHQGQSKRKISLVLYLNQTWLPSDGGELCLYSPEHPTQETGRVLPLLGRLVLFRSDLIPHEVCPGGQIRWSLTGWFRTDFI